MKSRLYGGLVALVALLVVAVPTWAQEDGQDRPTGIEKVYRDYRDDGVIEACDHRKRALERTLRRLPDEADIDTPDLRPALEAAIEQVEKDECEEEEPEATATPSPTAAPTATVSPAPTVAPAPTTDPDDSQGSILPPSGDEGGSNPPGADDVTPLEPEVTPVPPAVTPAPEPTGPPPAPTQVYTNDDDPVPAALIVLAGVLALLALLALLYAAAARLGWGEARLAGVRRTWSEAAFRAGGTWGDLADWIRVGR